jgi:hypothetical protein
MYDSIMRLAQEVANDLEHHEQMIKYLESEIDKEREKKKVLKENLMMAFENYFNE